MPSQMDKDGFKKLALRLATEGPVRALPTPRRIRVVFAKEYIAETTSAKYIWEHDYYPQYYVPRTAIPALSHNIHVVGEELIRDSKGKVLARLTDINYNGKVLKNIVAFEQDVGGKAAELAGLVRINFADADQWYEEDSPIFVHPKDPYKRIDIIPSTRLIRVSIEGTVLAEAKSSMHLYETSLPRRFYLPPTAVDIRYLERSDTTSLCPYKGKAEYYDVVLKDGKRFKDIIWYYTTPTIESAAIVGLLCFYNEKVDIEIEGSKGLEALERPKTHFA